MNPQEPQQQNNESSVHSQYTAAPPQMPPQPIILQPAEVTKKNHKKVALLLLIGPTALFILAIILYFISNAIANNTQPTDSELFTPASPIQTIFNILFFLCSAISIITWLPGLIAGIILLVKQSK